MASIDSKIDEDSGRLKPVETKFFVLRIFDDTLIRIYSSSPIDKWGDLLYVATFLIIFSDPMNQSDFVFSRLIVCLFIYWGISGLSDGIKRERHLIDPLLSIRRLIKTRSFLIQRQNFRRN